MPHPENIIPHQFKKGYDPKRNIGRPPRFVSEVIKDLESKGIERVSPSQVVGLYELLMNCTVDKLKDLANDDKLGWEIRQTAKYMIKNPDKAWNEIKDRAHGKAAQKTELTGKDGEKLQLNSPQIIINSQNSDIPIIEENEKE